MCLIKTGTKMIKAKIDMAENQETIDALRRDHRFYFHDVQDFPLELMWKAFSREVFSAGHMQYDEEIGNRFVI